ncbi:hypothetical protein CEUSTIGMA_g5071.t1 [Chlamydomonas eustigma]|uniref:TRAM domain-containing protein n=1 Tax=Chlamydomonas eustigma TaxID=1157962 RepID=A0A250X3H9_9CHLO|nr:hypothetical protein CEUSTIGMA_g5071.t1 [Chlamydomonas eustigma]|eukprot:GAX77628.1 hypothetical protein CEUSTIGMA_g5071.t1 [Chlamydomonas eustigma]
MKVSSATPSRTQSASSTSAPAIALGQVVELQCDRLALEGKGVCLLPPTNFVILCDRALPGEKLKAKITKVQKGFAEAQKLSILSTHHSAVSPRCPHFGPCGGCTLQSMSYEAQLLEKQNQVYQTLRRVGKLSDLELAMRSIAGCADIFEYRNKIQFTYSHKTWSSAAGDLGAYVQEEVDCQLRGSVIEESSLGLLLRGYHDIVVPVQTCHLQDNTANRILQVVRKALQTLGILPYNHPSGKGVLRHVVIRKGSGLPMPVLEDPSALKPASSHYMVTLLATKFVPKLLHPLAQAVMDAVPEVLGVTHRVPEEKSKTPRNGSPHSSHSSSMTKVTFKAHQMKGIRGSPSVTTVAAGHYSSALASPALHDVKVAEEKCGGGRDLMESPPHTSPPVDLSNIRSPTASGNMHLEGSQRNSHTLIGQSHVIDTLGELRFSISDRSFFQTNTQQAHVLYDLVRHAAALKSTDILLDLYCGTGAIGLYLASDCAAVLGVETVEQAVIDAQQNAALNQISNAVFLCADMTDLAELWLQPETSPTRMFGAPQRARQIKTGNESVKRECEVSKNQSANSFEVDDDSHVPGHPLPSSSRPIGNATRSVKEEQHIDPTELHIIPEILRRQPDVVVVDPARAGLTPTVIRFLKASGARRIVYVSCNPATQARDLALLLSPNETLEPSHSSSKKAHSSKNGSAKRSVRQFGATNNMSAKQFSSDAKIKQQQDSLEAQSGVFQLVSVQACDLFPHTDHVETVVVLDRI